MDSWEATPGVSTVEFAVPLEYTVPEGPMTRDGDEALAEGVLEV